MCLIFLQGEVYRFPVEKHQCGWECWGSPWERAGVGQASAGVWAAMTRNIGKPKNAAAQLRIFVPQQPLKLLISFYFSIPSEFITKPPLQTKRLSRAGEVKKNRDSVRCEHFPLHCRCLACSRAEAMWQRIRASRRRWRASAHTTTLRSMHAPLRIHSCTR